MSNTGSNDGFSEDWSQIGSSVEEVMIMAHGQNQSINLSNSDDANNQLTSTGDGKTNKSETEAVNIQDLTTNENFKNASLFLYTCHSADSEASPHSGQSALKGSKLNVAEAFAKTFTFKSVKGTAGGVSYNVSTITNFLRPYPNNNVWKVYYRNKK